MPDPDTYFLCRKTSRNNKFQTNYLPQSTIDTKSQVDCKLNYKDGENWMLTWERESCSSKEEAENIKDQIKAAGTLQGN